MDLKSQREIITEKNIMETQKEVRDRGLCGCPILDESRKLINYCRGNKYERNEVCFDHGSTFTENHKTIVGIRKKLGFPVYNEREIREADRKLPPMNTRQKSTRAKLQKRLDPEGCVLINKYLGNKTRMFFKCKRKHISGKLYDGLIINPYCQQCKTYESVYLPKKNKFYNKISLIGATVLGPYIDFYRFVEIRCKCGYTFETTPVSLVKTKDCCPECRRFKGYIKLVKIVDERGGKIIGIYIYAYVLIELECKKGHQWFSKPAHIFDNHWCPACWESAGERIVQEILTELDIKAEKEYRHPTLPRSRYDFHFYYESQEFLLEFDGKQHFDLYEMFTKTEEDLLYIHHRDKLKTLVTLHHRITIIRIDYTQMGKIREHLIKGIECPKLCYYSTPKLYEFMADPVPEDFISARCSIPASILSEYDSLES